MGLLILVNVFIAILSDAYAAVAADLNEDESPGNPFGAFTNKLREAMRKNVDEKMDLETFDSDDDGKVSAEELANATGIMVDKAKEIIAGYDDNDDGMLDSGEFEKLKDAI